MGFITVVGTLSFLFAGTWRHSSFRSTGRTSLCLEASPESSNNQQQAISPFNRTAKKYGLERAMEIQRENGRKGTQAHTEKYGSVFNATAQKYGLEKAQEIYSDNARNSTEKYGTIWDRMKSKHGLKKAKAMRRETAGNIMEKYGSIFNATVQKHGLEKALEIYGESGRKGSTAFTKKYGSIFNATVEKYGIEKALANSRKGAQAHMEKYGSVVNATVQKHGLEKAKEIWSQNAHKFTEKYGSAFNAAMAKYGKEEAKEMYRQNMRNANEAFMEKYTYEEIQQMSSNTGVKAARKQGKYSRYPGVNFGKARGKWRVWFSHRGQVHTAGAAHATEKDAALAHDEYVRKLGLKRPLHFPREGERTSYVDEPRDNK